MKNPVTIVLIFSLPILLSSSQLVFSTTGQEQFISYQDPKGMFTIQYPSDWEKKENQSGGVSFIVPETSAAFVIYIQSLVQLKELYHTDFDSLEQIVDRIVQKIQNWNSGDRLIPKGLNSTVINDQRAFRTESVPDTGTFSPQGDKILHIWSLVGDNAYTFTFSANRQIYQEYLPTIERMVNSFRFLNISTTTQATQITKNPITDEATPLQNRTTPSLPLGAETTQQKITSVETPLHEDQDRDGDPLNEEQSIIFACSISSSAEDLLGQFVGALNKDDCDFTMHYMSGKCEETSKNGIEMEKICGDSLIDYLDRYNLNNKNFPTDDNQFNEVVDKYLQGRQEAVEKAIS